jgi:hypothetical protein
MTAVVDGAMYRVICTTSLLFCAAPMEKGPWHPDKSRVLTNANWLRERGQDALVQESSTGKCFDVRGRHIGTSPMVKSQGRAAPVGFSG